MGVGGGCGCVGGRFFHGFGEAEADLSAAERGLAEADGAVVIFHGGADDVEADTAAARFGGLERGFIFFNAGPAGAAVVDDEEPVFVDEGVDDDDALGSIFAADAELHWLDDAVAFLDQADFFLPDLAGGLAVMFVGVGAGGPVGDGGDVFGV